MESERRKQGIRILAAIGMAVGMVAVSEMSGEKEVLFPEIVALLTGAWAAGKQPWKVSKLKIVVLMTVSSTLGICFVRYVPWPVGMKVIAAYFLTGGCLFLSRCSLAPMISACILPILMKTTSMLYPISVFLMSGIIVAGQAVMEKLGLREKEVYEPTKKAEKQNVIRWVLQTIAIGCVAFLPLLAGTVYVIAPPLLVLFTELCNRESGMRKIPVRIFILTVLCAVTGAGGRYVLCSRMHLPVTVAALAVIAVVYGIFLAGKRMVPPAGALFFLPFIIPQELLLWYPLEVAAGTLAFMVMALYVVAKEEKKEEQPSFVTE